MVLSAVQNELAATFWADLENAIAERLAERRAIEAVTPDESGRIVVPEGKRLVLSTNTAEAYTRLAEAFADDVVSLLK